MKMLALPTEPSPTGEPARIGELHLLARAARLAPEALPRLDSGPFDRRCRRRLGGSRDYEAWAIGWPPGGSIDLHDHGASAGAVLVVSGELTETRLFRRPTGRLGAATTTLTAGCSVSFPGHFVHDVVNEGSTDAISVHVYSPRLRSMTYYNLESGVLAPLRTVCYDHP